MREVDEETLDVGTHQPLMYSTEHMHYEYRIIHNVQNRTVQQNTVL